MVQNANPGFEVSDDNTVWTTNTQVEIFKLSYENGEANITVQSSDGEKVFAPGTENSYTFKLKNTGNVALDYTVDIDAYFTPGETVIPITARVNRYDGKWLVGSGDSYVDIPPSTAHLTAQLWAQGNILITLSIGSGPLRVEMTNTTQCLVTLPQKARISPSLSL